MLAGILAAVIAAHGCANSPPQAASPGGLTVETAVAEALASNRDLAVARAKLPIAESAISTARLRPNPELTVTADHLDLAGTHFTEENGGGPAELTVHVDVPWEQGGKRQKRLAVATNEHTRTRFEVADARRRLVFDVQSAFVDLLLAQRTVALAVENLASMQRVLEVSAERVRSGDLAEVEVIRTRVAVVQLQNDVDRRQLAMHQAQQQLALLLGRAPGAPLPSAAGDFRVAPASVGAPDELERAAWDRRPDAKALAADTARAAAETALQRANARGDLTVGAEFRRQEGIAGRNNSLGFVFGAPLPLFNRNQGEIARARGEEAEMARRGEALRAVVASEIRQAYAQFETARTLVARTGGSMLADATQVRSITEYAYKRGEASLIELLDAQRAFNDTMEGHLTAQAELARSLYLLDAASGQGALQ